MLKLAIDDRVLKDIIGDLYYPHSPYQFDRIPVEILGNVYEQFLGKVIRLTAGHQAKVEEKPEVKKAGGVFYTPAYIVDYIVKQTVGQAIEGKSPKQLRGFRVLDMACGSGSFMLGAYQYLLDYYLKWYVEHEDLSGGAKSSAAKRGAVLHLTGLGEWRLTIAEKKRILTEHLFGVDIDRQAVEVSKLSLLLKVLEDENDESLQMRLFEDDTVERALPNLDANIKCGNSLIGPDYFTDQLLPDPDELKRVNPFDWATQFPEAMKVGGFDCIIGNPPYIRIGNIEESWRPYLYKTFDVNHRFDIYIVFVQKAFELLSRDGALGFILPNKFFTADYGKGLRKFLSAARVVSDIVDFGDSQVFQGAITYTCLLFLSKTPHASLRYLPAQADKSRMKQSEQAQIDLPVTQFGEEPWIFVDTHVSALLGRLKTFPTLSAICNIARGLETGADDIFFFQAADPQDNEETISVTSGIKPEAFKIERVVVRHLVKGSVDLRRYFIESNNRYLFFPYKHTRDEAELISEKTLLKDFPLAWRYINGHVSELKARKGKYWYSFRRRNYDLRDDVPRLLIPSIGKRLSVSYDDQGQYHFVGSGGGGGGGYGVSVKQDISLSMSYLLGLLNSSLLDWIAKSVNSRFGSGYYSFNRQYIEQLPIRPIDFTNAADKAAHDRMVKLVDNMLQLHARLAAANAAHDREMLQRQIDATDRQIDALVYQLYGLTEAEIGIVEGR